MWLIYMSSILCAGLDAAGPSFENAGPNGRVDAGDAILVDGIHTDGGGLGLRDPYAHVSFYPNRGTRVQPGCGLFDITGESVCVNVHLPLYRSPEWCRRWKANCWQYILVLVNWLMTNLVHTLSMCLFYASSCFEQQALIIRRTKLY